MTNTRNKTDTLSSDIFSSFNIESNSNLRDFAWQEGYGSFSVSYSAIESVTKYIQNQEHHHSVITYEEEFTKFLKIHQIKYNERYVLG